MAEPTLVGQRLQQARENLSKQMGRKLSQADVSKLCGWDSQARISHYENGRRTPHGDDLQRLSEALNVSPEWILFGRGQTTLLSEDKQQAININVPIIEWSEASQWDKLYPKYQASNVITIAQPIGKRSFALTVEGDSMASLTSPSFPEGYLIIVDPDLKPSNRSFIIYNTDDDEAASFRQLVIEGNQQYLKVLNSNYPNPIKEAPSTINVLGVVREVTYMLE